MGIFTCADVPSVFGRLSFSCFGQISNFYVKFFSVHYSLVNWLTMADTLVPVITTLPLAWLAYKGILGFRNLSMSAAVFSVLGFMCITISTSCRSCFAVAFLGQIFNSFAMQLVMTTPPIFAVMWFPEKEVGTAISVNVIGTFLGGILGLIIPSTALHSDFSNYIFLGLFEDEMTQSSTTAAKTKPQTICGHIIDEPPFKRGSRHLIGIRNQGATCYLNSLLQTLFLTPEFREALFQLGPRELGSIDGKEKKQENVRVIPIQLQLLFARLLLIDQNACSTQELTNSFGWEDSEQLQQHDVQELSRILFDAIENSLVATTGATLIQDLFKGTIVNQIRCRNCGKVSERNEEFLDLTVSIVAKNNLESALSDMYQSHELMSGKNKYFCEKCNKLVDAEKGAKLGSVPPILTISLLRFNFDMKTLSRYKENGHFAFPMKLDIANYCKKNGEPTCTEYTLYSVIIHKGSAHRGHYHAYIRDVDGLGHSEIPVSDADYEPDFNLAASPDIKSPTSPSNPIPQQDNFGDMGAEETLACIIAKHGSVKMSELGKLLQEETGFSWSKKYRKKHGTMLKYIKSCDETFVVDDKLQTVALCISETWTEEIKVKENNLENAKEHACVQEKEQNIVNGHCNGNSNKMDADFSKKDVGKGDALEGCHRQLGGSWFNVNDESIKAISVHEIPSQFAGQQSAYMLFYRRKDLHRPKESWENVNYGIPPHIEDAMAKENEQLCHWREEHEKAVNRLDLHLHHIATCTFKDGLIFPADESGFLLHIDQRQTIDNLITEFDEFLGKRARKKKKQKLEIRQKSYLETQAQLPSVSNATYLSVTKILPHGGLHLYEALPKDQSTKLREARMKSGTHLFLWSYEQLFSTGVPKEIFNLANVPKRTPADNHWFNTMDMFDSLSFLAPGPDSEPISVKLSCELHKLCSCEVTFASPALGCFDNVYSYACQVLCAERKQILLERKILKEEEDEESIFVEVQEDFKGGVGWDEYFVARRKIIDSSFDEIPSCLMNGEHDSNLLKMQVRNHTCDENDDLDLREVRYYFEVPFNPLKTVRSLKSFIVEMLMVKVSAHKLRLTLLRNEEKLPLKVDKELFSLDLEPDDVILLEKEREPTPDELVVFVKPLAESCFIETVLSSSATVNQLVKHVGKLLKIKGNDWHLARSNCHGDKLSILEQSDDVIGKARISHGQYLCVCPGMIVNDDRLTLKLWLHPPPVTLQQAVDQHHGQLPALLCEGNPHLNSTSLSNCNGGDIRKWQSVDNLAADGPCEIGNIALEKDATFYDLQHDIKDALETHEKESKEIPEDQDELDDVLESSVDAAPKEEEEKEEEEKSPEKFLRIRVVENGVLSWILSAPDNTSIKRFKLQASSQLGVQWVDKPLGKDEVVVDVAFHIPATREYTSKVEFVCNSNAFLALNELASTVGALLDDLLVARKANGEWKVLQIKELMPQKPSSGGKKKGSKSSGKRKTPSGKNAKDQTFLLKHCDLIGVKILSEEARFSTNQVPLFDFDTEEDLETQRKALEKELEAEMATNTSKFSFNVEKTSSNNKTKKTSPKSREASLKIHVAKFSVEEEPSISSHSSHSEYSPEHYTSYSTYLDEVD